MANLFDIGGIETQLGSVLLAPVFRGETAGAVDALVRAFTGALLMKQGLRRQFISDLWQAMLTEDPVRMRELLKMPSFQKIAARMGVRPEDLQPFIDLAERIISTQQKMWGAIEEPKTPTTSPTPPEQPPARGRMDVEVYPSLLPEKQLPQFRLNVPEGISLHRPRTSQLLPLITTEQPQSVLPSLLLFNRRRPRGLSDALEAVLGSQTEAKIQPPTRYEFRSEIPRPLSPETFVLSMLATIANPTLAELFTNAVTSLLEEGVV